MDGWRSFLLKTSGACTKFLNLMALEIAAVGGHHVMRLVILSIVGIAKEK